MESGALAETGKQILILFLLSWMDAVISVAALAYSANVLLLILFSTATDTQSVHTCNLLLLHMTLRVACSLSLYGLLVLYNHANTYM